MKKKHQGIIFCHLEKCAGTFIGRMLELSKKRTVRHYMWVGHTVHCPTIKQLGLNQDMIIVGNIRNPYSFYVSLWAFSGIHKKGHYELIASKYPQHLHLYSDPLNIPNFREWLKLMLTGLLDEEFATNMKKYNIGLLTSRFFELYNNNDFSYLDVCCSPTTHEFESISKHVLGGAQIHEFELSSKHVDKDYMVNHFVRVEHLKDDLRKIDVPYVDKASNQSKHHKYSLYYGPEEAELVYRLDNYIFKKFGYYQEQGSTPTLGTERLAADTSSEVVAN
jgi:hypothetical protein